MKLIAVSRSQILTVCNEYNENEDVHYAKKKQ